MYEGLIPKTKKELKGMSPLLAVTELTILNTLAPILFLALVVDQYMSTGYVAFDGAEQFSKNYDKGITDYTALNGPNSTTIADDARVTASGIYEKDVRGRPLSTSLWVSIGALIAGGSIISLEVAALVIGHYYGILDVRHPLSDEGKLQHLFAELKADSGVDFEDIKLKDYEDRFLFGRYINDARNDPEKNNTRAYQFVVFLDMLYRLRTDPAAMSIAIVMVVGLMVFFGDNQYFKAMGLKHFNKAYDDKLSSLNTIIDTSTNATNCVLPYGTDLTCQGTAGFIALEAETKYIMDKWNKPGDQSVFFIAIGLAVIFLGIVAAQSCVEQCKQKPVVPGSTNNGNNDIEAAAVEVDPLLRNLHVITSAPSSFDFNRQVIETDADAGPAASDTTEMKV